MNVKKLDVAILVVLYGCEANKSNTLRTLMKFSSSFKNSRLVVWNNGPESINGDRLSHFEDFFDVELVQTLDNISLASIYNKFLTSLDAKNYVVLDHDTELNLDYCESILSFDGLLGVPKIYSMGKLHSPRFDKNRVTSKTEITAIGSGLVLSNTIVELLMGKYRSVFDERFVLYGVDTTFFYRLRKIINLEKVLMVLPELKHSLSSNEVESLKVSDFRVKEKSYDFGLRLRYYPTLDKFLLLLILFIKALYRRSPLNLRYVMESFLKGKHYRDKKSKNNFN
ncbi:hypothetical protein L9G16_16205 [Shewanella sp. A25]|nr:hypothetical protein [Shewanella shenzhenensis]